MSVSRLELRGLGKSYDTSKVVDGVDLVLQGGEFLSLLGPSGCGKTTTLRMIAGFIEPTTGTIEMNGKLLSAPGAVLPPERRNMSMIFQSYAIWPNMTVAENVAFGLKLRKLPGEEVKRRVHEILKIVQMGDLAGRYPAELSGGQQQRVALARAIVVQPTVLLLDEPLSNLDANLREEMRFEIRRLHDEFRITTIYVTHDQSEAMATSDRIAVMNAGRIEQVDAPHRLYTRPRTRFVAGFIGRTNLVPATRQGSTVAAEGFLLDSSSLELSASTGEKLLLSIRPQSLRLHAVQPEISPDRPVVQAMIQGRVYMGENWDYVVVPADSGLRLLVSAPPSQVHAAGDQVWLEFDPAQIVVVD